MYCPVCNSENPDSAKFCNGCGGRIAPSCSKCGTEVSQGDRTCRGCGHDLKGANEAEKLLRETQGERKYVTILFSDLSGYTSISERLDPEEVRSITTRIFSKIAEVIDRYQGFVEKYAGDAVMAVFGAPSSHEDDPTRAVKAAVEIHDLVHRMSPQFEAKIGRPLSMHSGINTGLVVTGEVDLEKGTHGLMGDAINTAARILGLAKTGEILVGHETYRQSEGHFEFEKLEPAKLKGKSEPVSVYRVTSPKKRPVTTHRLSGIRADLIGRKSEMHELRKAVTDLKAGKGGIFSICGDAGTGKSRLIEDFKATLDLGEIQWLEGHAYAYSQNMPYFPIIDLLNQVFQINEGDSPANIREKIQVGLEDLLGTSGGAVPYVGGLYSLRYTEVKDVSPEFWKSRLQSSLLEIFVALAKRAPAVFIFEDMHWAAPSSMELLRRACLEIKSPAIVIYAYRPPFILFTESQSDTFGDLYRKITLQSLSLVDTTEMLKSLLKTDVIPPDLVTFVRNKAEGNPFYLEELINSLIESKILIQDYGNWLISKPLNEWAISPSVNGLISDRVDRLAGRTKRILQEASVIGRTFHYDVLQAITENESSIDSELNSLEQLDIIRLPVNGDREYAFKHSLTQEVVYNSLLKRERKMIHERVGLAIEEYFKNRLPEFYEILGYHFRQSQSFHKAVYYLIQSGEKNLKRYSVEESHRYYNEAFEIMKSNGIATEKDKLLMLDLLIKWALVYYYRGDFKNLTAVLSAHKDVAGPTENQPEVGMFYAWLGFALYVRHNYNEAYGYLLKALRIGEKIDDDNVVGFVSAWLTFLCGDLGLFEDSLMYSRKALKVAEARNSDPYIFFKSLGGIAQTCFYTGDVRKAYDAGSAALKFGKERANVRGTVMGHVGVGISLAVSGELNSAIEEFKKAVEVSVDPFYRQVANYSLGAAYVLNENFEEAGPVLEEVISFGNEFGCEWASVPASLFSGIVQIATGKMSLGLGMVKDSLEVFKKIGRKPYVALAEYVLGKVFFTIANPKEPVAVSIIVRNIPFILRNRLFAIRKAEAHFMKSVALAYEINAKGILGLSFLDMGFLNKACKNEEKSRKFFALSAQTFAECNAANYLEQAKRALKGSG
jgi:class 3 adenylate cyclase/tetratricopeptide (TPR) repeat protein